MTSNPLDALVESSDDLNVNTAEVIEEDIQRMLAHFETTRSQTRSGLAPLMVGYLRNGRRAVALEAPLSIGGDSVDGTVSVMLFALRVLRCHSVLYGFDARMLMKVVGPSFSEQIQADTFITLYAHPGESFIRGYEYHTVSDDDMTFESWVDRDDPVCAEPADGSHFWFSSRAILGIDALPRHPQFFLGAIRDQGFKIGILDSELLSALPEEMRSLVTDLTHITSVPA